LEAAIPLGRLKGGERTGGGPFSSLSEGSKEYQRDKLSNIVKKDLRKNTEAGNTGETQPICLYWRGGEKKRTKSQQGTRRICLKIGKEKRFLAGTRSA